MDWYFYWYLNGINKIIFLIKNYLSFVENSVKMSCFAELWCDRTRFKIPFLLYFIYQATDQSHPLDRRPLPRVYKNIWVRAMPVKNYD